MSQLRTPYEKAISCKQRTVSGHTQPRRHANLNRWQSFHLPDGAPLQLVTVKIPQLTPPRQERGARRVRMLTRRVRAAPARQERDSHAVRLPPLRRDGPVLRRRDAPPAGLQSTPPPTPPRMTCSVGCRFASVACADPPGPRIARLGDPRAGLGTPPGTE